MFPRYARSFSTKCIFCCKLVARKCRLMSRRHDWCKNSAMAAKWFCVPLLTCTLMSNLISVVTTYLKKYTVSDYYVR